jgi:hypothetical protein
MRLLGIAALAAVCSCAYPLQMLSETVPVDGKPYKVLGWAEARSCSRRVLFFPVSWGEGLADVYDEALEEHDGTDALIEVTIDREELELLIYASRCTSMRGRAIKFAP